MPVTGDVAMPSAPIKGAGIHQSAPQLHGSITAQMKGSVTHKPSRSRQLLALSHGHGGAAPAAGARSSTAPALRGGGGGLGLGSSKSAGAMPTSPQVVQNYVRQNMHRAMIQA